MAASRMQKRHINVSFKRSIYVYSMYLEINCYCVDLFLTSTISNVSSTLLIKLQINLSQTVTDRDNPSRYLTPAVHTGY